MTLQPPAAPEVSAPAGRPAPLRWPFALPLVLAAGAALLLALPPYDQWWLSPVGVALLAVATRRRRLRAGFGLGFLAGLVLFFPLLQWTSPAAGWLPWALLSTAEAAFLGLTGLATAWMSPLLDRWRPLWPPVLGLLWVAQEAVRDRAPFGGFPWGRLAFSQSDAPGLRLAAYGGAPLVTFAVAAAGGCLVALVWRRPTRRALGYLAALAALVAGPAALPDGGTSDGTTKVVAIVQGNVPRLGLDFNSQRRAVLDNHAGATLKLAEDVRNGKAEQPDLVIWPENASDIDPLRNEDAATEIQAAADAIDAPILVGAVLRTDNANDIKNAGILWNPGTGPDLKQQYVKRHPVPFAEYMPLRTVARFVSDKVDLVKNMLAGDRVGVVRTAALTLGDVICFEVAYDGIVRDTVTGGAQILTVQTNNATFNEAEARQQMAMVRLRAVEHGREALMASTVGVSGFVDTDGSVHEESGFNEASVMVREMHLGESRTLATRLGVWPETVMAGLAVVALAGAFVLRRNRRTGGPDDGEENDGEEKAEAR